MCRTILCATDGFAIASLAVENAASIATGLGAKLTLVTVSPSRPTFDQAELGMSIPANIYDSMRQENAARRSSILKAAQTKCGGRSVFIHMENLRAFEGILAAAETIRADRHGLTWLLRD